MKGYVIGNKVFKTKNEIKEYYTEILNSYSLNDKLNREDSQDLYCLLRHHPGFEEKRGSGIRFFKVETAVQLDIKYAKHRCFWIHRTDGTKVDFSLHECYRHKGQIEKVEL